MARKTARSADRASGLNVSKSSADVTALSLLSAVGFKLDIKSGDLVWSDDDLAKSLLKSPVKRIPRRQAAFDTILSDTDRVRRAQAIAALTYDHATYDLRYQIKTFDGDLIWVQERGRRISGRELAPGIVMGVLSDITDLKREEMATAFAASHDPLTRLWNRERFLEALTYERSASALREEPGFLACIQIENLAEINARKGQDIGDEVLRDVAAYLKTSVAEPLSAARITGAAFGLLCPGLREPDAKQYLKNICDWIAGQGLCSPIELTLSISMHAFNAAQSDAETQLGLLISQVQPVGNFFTSTKHPRSAVEKSKQITADDILLALNDRKLSLAYQPIIDAATRTPHHYECLLRLIGSDGRQESAGAMIMAAESLGYIHLLDRRALEIGTQVLRGNVNVSLAFNVSAGTIRNQFAAESYLAALRTLGPDASRVTIELTETLALKDPNEAGKFAQKARELGCRFAIDDFGSGHTTFQNLMTIEADMIKIDGTMVKNLADMPLKETFIRIMVDFAQTFGVEIVAEMVNSEEDADKLQTLGIDYFQGYMFGKPAAEPMVTPLASSEQSQVRL